MPGFAPSPRLRQRRVRFTPHPRRQEVIWRMHIVGMTERAQSTCDALREEGREFAQRRSSACVVRGCGHEPQHRATTRRGTRRERRSYSIFSARRSLLSCPFRPRDHMRRPVRRRALYHARLSAVKRPGPRVVRHGADLPHGAFSPTPPHPARPSPTVAHSSPSLRAGCAQRVRLSTAYPRPSRKVVDKGLSVGKGGVLYLLRGAKWGKVEPCGRSRCS